MGRFLALLLVGNWEPDVFYGRCCVKIGDLDALFVPRPLFSIWGFIHGGKIALVEFSIAWHFRVSGAG